MQAGIPEPLVVLVAELSPDGSHKIDCLYDLRMSEIKAGINLDVVVTD